ncbi:ubiquitin 3 binding protein But2 C-terminal domain-containing protein [Amylocarpus encephaloides]|uniref:Ubiquitin 3 binding protein But2 C-terminal domain-containing protein n=1 Tax=Amylocarpus encephaloides TaxID=45428 RepID=A0A9P7YJK0_9HELO|nr:ubiquitin 3 binding protein But2 C-terminal domain-containing protein [Amylocarpus encephaloides]
MPCQFQATPSLIILLGLAASSLGIVVPREAIPCNFYLDALGLPDGMVRQDAIGQPRVGGSFPQNSYIIDSGTMKDSQGHTCIILENTSQLQCTQGVSGNIPFAFSDDFLVQYNQNSNWLACPATGPGADGSHNIYSDSKEDKTGCQAIQLRAGAFACTVLGRPDSSSVARDPASSTKTPSTPAATVSCPKDIGSGTFQYPHLIVPTSSESPETAFGNSYTAHISGTNDTLFNFDIPAVAPYLGTCSLVFQFPYSSDLAYPNQPDFYYSGIEQEVGSDGGLSFALLSGLATSGTTYKSTPAIASNYGKIQVFPGNNYTVASFPCKPGKTRTFSITSVGGVELDFFQDSRPDAIGPYIVPCA